MSDVAGIASDQLRAFVLRIEKLEDEKKEIQEQVKEVYSEAAGEGFDKKIIRKIIARRKIKANDLAEQEELMNLYMVALGMV